MSTANPGPAAAASILPPLPTWPIVGMTGTQGRMVTPEKHQNITPEARATFVAVLQEVGAKELHHGDCVGADAAAHAEALALGLRITIHPPDVPESNELWAHCAGHPKLITTLPPLAYIARNRQIVNSVNALIVLPFGFEEELRSGTWSTYRYARGRGRMARKCSIPTVIIYPDGSRKYEGLDAAKGGLEEYFGSDTAHDTHSRR